MEEWGCGGAGGGGGGGWGGVGWWGVIWFSAGFNIRSLFSPVEAGRSGVCSHRNPHQSRGTPNEHCPSPVPTLRVRSIDPIIATWPLLGQKLAFGPDSARKYHPLQVIFCLRHLREWFVPGDKFWVGGVGAGAGRFGGPGGVRWGELGAMGEVGGGGGGELRGGLASGSTFLLAGTTHGFGDLRRAEFSD